MAIIALQKRVHSISGTQKYVSWEDFKKKYLSREDNYKYEWLNGSIEKTKRTMDFTQLYILRNLLQAFRPLVNAGKVTGEIMSEGDIFFAEVHRRPDIFYLTDEQVDRTAYGENQVPAFVIEVISTNDQINKMHLKMQNYRSANVQIVWHILPQVQEVHVYWGEDLRLMRVCKDDDMCTAAPVLPDFIVTANDVFRKPPKPV